jgi:hypothetical protein
MLLWAAGATAPEKIADASMLLGTVSLGAVLRNVEIVLGSIAEREVARGIDLAIVESGLRVTMRGTLRKFPGCVHWHVKRGREAGTLEITVWEGRAWFTIQEGRKGKWVEEGMGLLVDALRRRMRGERGD